MKRLIILLAILSLIPLAVLAKGAPSKPTPLFDDPTSYDVGFYTYSVAAADLDGDGDLDLAATIHEEANIAVLFNDGEGNFGEATYYPVSHDCLAITAADLDGDEDIDLAVVRDRSDSIYNLFILYNNGDGTFSSPDTYRTGLDSTNVIAADFDGDLDMDLAVTNFMDNSVSILMNYTLLPHWVYFESPVQYTTSICNLTDLFSIDMDGDLDLDIIAVGLRINDVFVLLNHGDGTFADPVAYPHGGYYAHSVTSADFDGDGDNDVATANDYSDNLSILYNNGDGTLSSPVMVTAGLNPVSIVAADLDNDGDPDLAVSNIGSTRAKKYTISVFMNKNGAFSTSTDFGSGEGPAGIIAADLDHDLDDDLVVAVAYDFAVETFFNTTRTSCCMIRGDADGSGQFDIADANFLVQYLYHDGPAPSCMDEADVDGDGDVDQDDIDYILAYLFEGGPAPVPCP